MAKKVKEIFKVIVFIALIMAMILGLSVSVDPTKTGAGTAKADKVVAEIKLEKKDTIDAVIIGDSEAYSAVSPLQMYEKYGFTSYVAASPAQTSFQALDMLEQVFECQSPKLCILEVNLFFRTYSIPAAVVPKLERAFPIFKYHNMWKGIVDPDYEYDTVASTNFKGYRYSVVVNASKNVDYMTYSEEAKEIDASNIYYLQKIIDLCEENNTELLFIRTPSSKNWDYTKHNGALKYAQEKNIPFIDFNMSDVVTINWNYDTRDRGDHVNHKGAYKVTKYLGKFINDNFDMPDRRNDSKYASWNDDLKAYNKLIGKE